MIPGVHKTGKVSTNVGKLREMAESYMPRSGFGVLTIREEGGEWFVLPACHLCAYWHPECPYINRAPERRTPAASANG